MEEQRNRIRKFIGKIDTVDTAEKFIEDFVRPLVSNVGYVYKFLEKKNRTLFSLRQVDRALQDPKPYGCYGLFLSDIHSQELSL